MPPNTPSRSISKRGWAVASATARSIVSTSEIGRFRSKDHTVCFTALAMSAGFPAVRATNVMYVICGAKASRESPKKSAVLQRSQIDFRIRLGGPV